MTKIALLVLCLMAPLSSHALFEIRAGYGGNTLDEDSYAGTKVDNGKGLNLDFIFEPPVLTDIGIGLRYEMMKYDFPNAGFEGNLERLSLLLNYRFIDTIAYFGILGTIGISNDFETKGAGGRAKWDDKTNFSIGAEGGISLGLIQVGAEIGKFFGEFERAGQADLDLSGLYYKILVGFGF